MSDLNLCRICFKKDVKLYHLKQFDLKHYYEEITRNKMKMDKLPQWFCFECAALLHKYHKFKEKCNYGQDTLVNLFCKGYMTYEVVEDLRKNRKDLLSTIDYIIPNKHTKTYHMNHKPLIKPSEIENVLIREFNEDTIKYEYIPENDDENITLDKIRGNDYNIDKLNNTKTDNSKGYKEEPALTERDNMLNNLDDDFDMDSVEHTFETKLDSKTIEDKPTEYKTDLIKDNSDNNNFTANNDTVSKIFEKDLNVKDGRDAILFSLLNSKPKRSKKKSEVEIDPDSKPRKFEKKKKARLNNDNWEIKILSEEQALEQFRQRSNNSKYMKFNFKCTKCLKGFSKNDILLRHNKQCHDEGKFECRFCHTQFKRKFQLGRHMVEHYYVYQCLRCDLKCNLLSTAVFHEDSHNGVIRTCKDCGEQFKHVSTYYTHLRMSHKNSHICKLCGASFVSETGLELHTKRQHCISEEITEQQNANIHCEKCDVSFVSQRAFDEHLSQSKLHEDEQPPQKKRSRKEIIENATTCRFCSEKFTTRAECRKHAASVHRGAKVGDVARLEQDRVMCEICGAWFVARCIEVHMNRHTKKKVFPCQHCGKEFLCKAGYSTHQAKHSGIRPHACKICHKRFSKKYDMETHYRRVHLKEPYPKRNRKKNTDGGVSIREIEVDLERKFYDNEINSN